LDSDDSELQEEAEEGKDSGHSLGDDFYDYYQEVPTTPDNIQVG
jgi:hypothetical protein